MSHVADGILHAYLDGALDALSEAGELPDGATAADVRAHLGACADCRARLEAERAIRESAGAVLNDASLQDVNVPAFAGVTSPRRARRTGWLPLGWAASVLLAVGAGWWGSEAWRTDRVGGVAVEQESTQAPRQRTSTDASERASTSATADRSYTQGTSDRPSVESAAAPAEPDEQATEASGRVNARSASGALPGASGSSDLAAASAQADQVQRRAAGDTETMAAAPSPTMAAAPAPRVAAGNAAGAREIREPIGVALSDTGMLNLVRQKAVALEPIVVPQPVGTPAASRSFTTAAPPPAVGRTGASRDMEAQNAAVLSGMRDMAAFDSIIARERSGRLHFFAAAPRNQRTIDDQLFLVADASVPVIEVAPEIGQTTVRMRQTLTTGEQVEIVTWQTETFVLDQLVVTGVPAGRSDAPARREAAAPQVEAGDRDEALQVISPTARRLGDGRRELVLRSSAGSTVWIAVRARMSESELRALTGRLTRR